MKKRRAFIFFHLFTESNLTLDNNCKKSMGVVDRKDVLIGNYLSVQKTLKWTAKVFFLFIEEALLSSSFLLDKVNPENLRFMQFLLEIVEKTINQSTAVNIPQIFYVFQVFLCI